MKSILNFLMPCLCKLINKNRTIDTEIVDVDKEEYKTLLYYFYDLHHSLTDDKNFAIENFCDNEADPIILSS